MITLEMPSSQAEIPDVLRRLRAETARLRGELAMLHGAIQAVQGYCEHPEAMHVRGSSMGESWTKCDRCGKEL